MADFDNTRSIQFKPDFDMCLARIYAWYEQRIIDRPPVRFHHHNIEYEKHRTVKGPWKTCEERWLDVDFQVQTFIDSLETTEFLGETFPVYWPNMSALAYNLFLGQPAVFDDVILGTVRINVETYILFFDLFVSDLFTGCWILCKNSIKLYQPFFSYYAGRCVEV